MPEYTNNLRLREITTGDESGTWGATTNSNLDLIADAFGSGTEGLSGTTHTTTMADSTTASEARAIYMRYTGALGGNNTITLAPNTINKLWIIENATTDSGSGGPYSIIISQGSGDTVTIPNGRVAVVYADGAGGAADVKEAFANLKIGPSLTVGNAAEEDTKIVFDGHAQDFYVGLDDSADDLVIGLGSTVGTTPAVTIDEDQAVVFPAASVTVGDGTAEDTKLVYNGNAQDFYIGLDDSADDLVIGLGSTVGTTPAVTIDENQAVVFPAASVTIGDGTAEDTKLVFDGNAQDYYVGLDDTDDFLKVGLGSAVGTTPATTIDTSLNFLVELITAETLYTLVPKLQVETTGSDAGLSAWRNENGAGGPYLFLGKSRGTALNSDTIVQDDDVLGSIMFVAADGVDRGNAAASIIAYIDGSPGENDTPGRLQFNTSADGSGSPTTRMTILSDGNVGLGTTSPDAHLEISAGDNAPTIKLSESDDTNKMLLKFASDVGEITVVPDKVLNFKNDNTTRMSIAVGGAVNVAGAFSKGSGSFRIDHPLPEKKDTHYLVHSFIEGPKADLIYRGTVDLSGGYAQVDLDDAAGMTEGTWELLCRDPQCWIQNDSGWDAVRGSVEGNTLTVECEETDSDDTVSWMVVAERCDPHIMETDWTDEDGHVIVEPEKPEEEE